MRSPWVTSSDGIWLPWRFWYSDEPMMSWANCAGVKPP